MAAALSFLPPPTVTPQPVHGHKFRLKPLLASSVSTPPFPSKQKKRKNHLRPKILKTLTKPFPTAPLAEIEPIIPIPLVEPSPDKLSGAGEFDKVEDFLASESTSLAGEYSGSFGNISTKSVLKFCGYLVGLFLFQTICTVWVMGNANSEDKDKNLDGKFDNKLDNKGGVLVNGNGKLGFEVSNVELEKRVSEIRALAREVRERESRERKEGNYRESDLEREISARLDRIEKRLNAKKEKLPEQFMKYLGLFGNVEDEFSDDDLGSEGEDDALVFKKKFKFKNPSMNQSSSPKGFYGLKDRRGLASAAGSDINGDLRKVDHGAAKTDRPATVKLNVWQNDGNELEKKNVDLQTEMGSGAVQENSEEWSSIQAKNSMNSKDLEIRNTQKLTEENQESANKFDGRSSRGSRKRPVSVAKKVENKQLDPQTDMWWFKLPYVLAILMRKRTEHRGFYALQTASQSNEHDFSYTIAFEDRGDANNFCHLLESFFEDADDFSADIVPLPTKEVKSHAEKVIVVKKGQLKLYAGQPLVDVEMALRSLLETKQNI